MSIIMDALKKSQERTGVKKPEQNIPLSSKKTLGIAISVIIIIAISVLLTIKQFFLVKDVAHRLKAKEKPVLQPSRAALLTAPSTAAQPAPAQILIPAQLPVGAQSFEPILPPEPQTPSLILNGIMYLDKKPRAIINGSVVCEGDMIDGARVVKINQNNVILDFNNSDIILNLRY